LLPCSTARSQPDDHNRGYEHVRLDSRESSAIRDEPDAVEGREELRLAFRSFLRYLLKLGPGGEPNPL
jgi:hypothetical protein